MQKFIELLMREPLLAVIVIGWIFGILGRLMTRAAKARAEAARRAGSRPVDPARLSGRPTAPSLRPAGPSLRPTGPSLRPGPSPRPATLAQAPATAARPRREHPTAEEVAAEMRRILGMEPDAPARRAPEPVPARPPRYEPESSERAPEPLRTTKLGQLATHVDPSVGAGIQQRRAPMSGSVGAQQLGMLGGRAKTATRALRRGGSPLVDLSNLPRAIVLREIFDRPLALRDLDGR